MFGQSSTPFGSPQGGFGQANTAPAFGSPAPAPAPFGAPAAPAGYGGFGAPAPAPSGFGGFGAPAPAPAGFGSSFGTPAPAPSAFGAPGGFGAPAATSSPFGAPAPAPSGGMFGAPPAPSGGLFGAPAPAPSTGFGAPSSGFGGGGFGATPSAAPAFGGGSSFGAAAPAPSTGLFGAPAPAPGGFASSGFGSTTSTFGAPAPAPAGGLFGAPAAAPAAAFGSPAPAVAGGGGTKVQPYEVTNRQDGTSMIILQAITAMPAYESKSFEELRFEDYSQGNRGAGTPQQGGGFGGGFGAPAPAPAGGMFGAPAPAPGGFGAPAPAPGGFGSTFGSPAPAPFGAPPAAPSAFGAPAPAPFGAPAPGGFGAPAPASGAFGSNFGSPAPAPGGLFGAPAPAPGGLFGSTPAPAPGGLFGAPAAQPPGAFGAPAPAPGGLFGAPAAAPAPGGGLFGAPAAQAPGAFGATGYGASAFGSPAPAPGGGMFGAPGPAPGAFGAPSPGGLYGAPAPAPGGMFGAKPPGTSLFGAPAMAPAPAYGAPMQAPYQYGAPAPPAYGAPMPAAPPVGSVMPPGANEILTSQLTALENKRKEIEKSDNFRSKPAESSLVNAVTLSENEGLSSLTPIRASYPTYRASPRSSAKVRPRGFASPEKMTTPSLSRLGSGGRPMAGPDSFVASSATRLVINPSPKPKMRLMLESAPLQNRTSPLKITVPDRASLANGMPPLSAKATDRSMPTAPAQETRASPSGHGLNTPGRGGKGFDYYQQVIGSPDEAAGSASPAKKNVAPKLTKAGYSCTPSIEALQAMPAEDLAAVPKFSMTRAGVGKIEWEGAVDVRGADFDSVVIIEPKSASVYMKEEEESMKPPVGTKLNRSAILTLEGVFAPDDTQGAHERFAKKVERQTKKMGAELISFDAVMGEWKLRVQHFSRYGLDEDDSESEPEAEPHFESGEREGRSRAARVLKQRKDTPYKPRRNMAMVSSEEEVEETALVSDVEMTDDSMVLQKAESVFTSMQSTLKEQMAGARKKGEDEAPFPEETEATVEMSETGRFVPTADDLLAASSMGGICSNIAEEAGVKSSSTDFGLRMGRSFRVGWSPDGSLLCLKPFGVLVRRRPTFTEPGSTDQLKYLEKHKAHSRTVQAAGNGPQFYLPSHGSELQSTVKSYAEESDGIDNKIGSQGSIAKQSFSLLKCMVDGKEKSNDDQFMVIGETSSDVETLQSRHVYAIKQWLVDSCANGVDSEIRTAKAGHEKYAALLAAVSGGDLEKACSVAEELGHLQLATMLASGPEARKDILKEVMAWADSGASSKIPDELIRTYFLIGGDLKMEEDIYRRKYSSFDWRRRFAMRLAYDCSSAQQSLSSIIQEYERNLSRGVAPYPQPQYLSGKSTEEIQCVLYRLLRLGKHDLEVSLREVIDPLGHTSSVHDFSLSFHLASTISAMGCPSPLSDVEEQSLIDGYVAQLVTQGNWEWAVYVSLCLLDASSTKASAWKKQRAQSLVLQHYRNDISNAEKRRKFLESVGVPSEWFEEALALRCSTNGDAFGYLQHMMKVSTDDACITLEQILIPNMLFMNKDRLEQSRPLLEVFSVNESSLATAMFDFFQVYENILALERSGRAEIDTAVPLLLEACEDVEQVFAAYRSGEERLQGPALRLIPDTKLVPMASFLAEGLSQISLFKLQLRALKAGISISSTASQILNLSQPKDFNESGISARENIVRWLM